VLWQVLFPPLGPRLLLPLNLLILPARLPATHSGDPPSGGDDMFVFLLSAPPFQLPPTPAMTTPPRASKCSTTLVCKIVSFRRGRCFHALPPSIAHPPNLPAH